MRPMQNYLSSVILRAHLLFKRYIQLFKMLNKSKKLKRPSFDRIMQFFHVLMCVCVPIKT